MAHKRNHFDHIRIELRAGIDPDPLEEARRISGKTLGEKFAAGALASGHVPDEDRSAIESHISWHNSGVTGPRRTYG
ncbi:MAG TPA: hypothetical protein PKX87_05950 [Alphaproteobacteria bacterium]|nr:hypothetical protein [Alphaproteobacteria bacterium]